MTYKIYDKKKVHPPREEYPDHMLLQVRSIPLLSRPRVLRLCIRLQQLPKDLAGDEPEDPERLRLAVGLLNAGGLRPVGQVDHGCAQQQPSTRQLILCRALPDQLHLPQPHGVVRPANLHPENVVLLLLLLMMAGSTAAAAEMEFLDINSTKDSSLLLFAIHSPFYWRILKKTILFSNLKILTK